MSQRLIVGTDTEKVSVTSCLLGVLRSTAASTRNLRSFEYGFMLEVSPRISDHASRCELIALALLQVEIVFLLILVVAFVIAGLMFIGVFIGAVRRNPNRSGGREGREQQEHESEERRDRGDRS